MQTPVMVRYERRACFVDYHRNGSRDLRDRLVRRHLPIARKIARRFARRGVPIDDLNQVASIGLIHAVDRFDPQMAIPFDAYAASTIIGEIKHHFRDRAWDLRVPRPVQNLHLAVNVAVERLTSRLGRSPNIAELAEAVGAPCEAVVEAIEAGAAFNVDSISPVPSQRDTYRDRMIQGALGVEDPWLTLADERLMVEDMIAELPPRERMVIRLYFWDRASQDAIASRLGISQMHVSRLVRGALAQLRAQLVIDDRESQ